MKLGELIKHLESLPQKTVLKKGIHEPHSYRGDYSCLAFEPCENQKVKDCLRIVRGCLSCDFIGYKGGLYVMTKDTTCHLSEYGEAEDEYGIELEKRILGEAMPSKLIKKVYDLVGKKIAFAKLIEYKKILVLRFHDGTYTIIYADKDSEDAWLDFMNEEEIDIEERFLCGFLSKEEYNNEKKKEESEDEQREYKYYLELKRRFEGRVQSGLATATDLTHDTDLAV